MSTANVPTACDLPLSIAIFIPYIRTTVELALPWFVATYVRDIHQDAGKRITLYGSGKYCSRCEYFFVTQNLFCECCGMRLRASPAAGAYKEKAQAKKRLIAVA
jgi:hypothetical protein